MNFSDLSDVATRLCYSALLGFAGLRWASLGFAGLLGWVGLAGAAPNLGWVVRSRDRRGVGGRGWRRTLNCVVCLLDLIIIIIYNLVKNVSANQETAEENQKLVCNFEMFLFFALNCCILR